MVNATHISFIANDRSYFSLIKKEIRHLATEAGLKASRINELDLIVAEMTSNLYKYSTDGEILVGAFANSGNPYIEIISLDRGPGIAYPAKMIQDGMSTSNTLGHGLGSMKRLSDNFDIYSQLGWGTIVLSRVFSKPEKPAPSGDLVVRPIVISKPGETVSGDGFIMKRTGKYAKMMLADGLGHGPEANHAVCEAAAAFRIFPDYSPSETLRFIHNAIKKTRGAVINIIGYEYAAKEWTTAGIGNITLRVNGPVAVKNHMSYNGIVGHNIPATINNQRYPGDQFNQVMLCSDGMKTRIDPTRYPLMYKYDSSILAAAIYKDYARKNDDMSVVIAKLK